MWKRSNKNFTNFIVMLLLLAYLALGVSVYRDYGISADEPTERISTLVNVKYALNFWGADYMSEYDIPDLETYIYRNYGTFLQMPSVIFEVTADNLGDIFYGRHLYTFFLCVAGYVAFFLLLKTLFQSKVIGVLGTLMVALYPRFFAEQFYNIKDMIFVSVFMVCMLTTVMLIKSRFSRGWVILFAVSVAIASNVRIVGIVFLLLVLGYLFVDFVMGKTAGKYGYEVRCRRPFLSGTVLLLVWFAAFVLMLPVAWEHPLRGVWEVFSQFSNYDNWDSTIVFMGKVIGKNEIPWFYVPVWMLVSVPVWYFLLCIASVATGIGLCIRRIREKEKFFLLLVTRYKYVLWCVLLMAVPWLGIVIMHSTIYNGWRHCYFFLPPLVLFALYGVDYLRKKGRRLSIACFLAVLLGGICQVMWIWSNHPYEMVYFNSIGKYFAAGFDRDYWHLTTADAVRYIAENETDGSFSVKTPGNDYYKYMLSEEEQNRIIEEEEPRYYIETYRGKTGNELMIEGYDEIYSIIVNNFKVATVYKSRSEVSRTVAVEKVENLYEKRAGEKVQEWRKEDSL